MVNEENMPSITLNMVGHNIATARISKATLARLADLSTGTISNAFRGIGYLGADKEAALLTLTTRIIELQEALRPLREPTEADDLKRLLDAMDESNITPDFVRSKVSEIFGQ
jgi:hypothetical protein